MTTRLRLTLMVAGMSVLIAAALVAALLLARSRYIYRDLGQYAMLQARVAEGLIQATAAEGEPVAVPSAAGPPALTPRLQDLLEATQEILVLVDTSGVPIFVSAAVVELSREDWAAIQTGYAMIPDNGPAALVPAAGGTLLVAHAVEGAPGGVARIIAGVSAAHVFDVPREFLLTLMFALPVLVLGAAWGAYVVVGRSFNELDRIAEEVTAITDGRSLHRRLPMRQDRGEFATLVETLNAMIARLETSFMGLRRFTADASHELKTPLAVLRADVERAMSHSATAHEKAVALEEALQETARMTDLVESLLTLARADEGRFDIVREPVDIGSLVQEVYETALILGEEAGVNVNLPFNAQARVLGDRTRLRQLFLNLVTNAIKYTPPGGRVDIGLGRHPDHVAFAVRDTGMGIAVADLPHIFDRFWRADRARSRAAARGLDRGGFGLGLAISQWIAQAHGGTLTVSSRLGRGSLFTVTLPLAPEDVAPVKAVSGSEPGVQDGAAEVGVLEESESL